MEKRHCDDVKLTSSLCSVVHVVMVLFIFLVTLNVKMTCTRNYENLLTLPSLCLKY